MEGQVRLELLGRRRQRVDHPGGRQRLVQERPLQLDDQLRQPRHRQVVPPRRPASRRRLGLLGRRDGVGDGLRHRPGRLGRGDGRRLRGDREHLRQPGPERPAELPALLQRLEAAPLPLRRLLRGDLVALGLQVVVPGARPQPPVPEGRPPLDRLEVARPLAEVQPRRLVGPPRPEVAVRQEGRIGLLPLAGLALPGEHLRSHAHRPPPARAARPVVAVRIGSHSLFI